MKTYPHIRNKRNYWLNSKFQGSFLAFCLIPFFAQLLCALLFPTPSGIICSGAIIFLILMPAGIIFSHRICGPIYRIDQQMRKDSSAHHMGLVKFREKDFFPELSGSYNVLSMAVNQSRSIK